MAEADLRLERFQAEYFAEYVSWFADEELNRHLGPMALTDEPWLAAVLGETESDGATWAVFRGDEMVAVVEAAYDPENTAWAAITALATRPHLRRQGIGEAVLRQVLARHQARGISEHIGYVHFDNEAARRCIEKVGFAADGGEPNEQGFVTFRLGSR